MHCGPSDLHLRSHHFEIKYVSLQKRVLMAVYVKAIPTLRGAAADRFEKMSEDNLRRRASVSFSKEAANSYAILKKKQASK
jgi:hypothetical protein